MNTLEKILADGLDITAEASTDVLKLSNVIYVAVHIQTVGTIEGTASLEVATGLNLDSNNEPTSWEELSSQGIGTGGATHLWLDDNVPYTYLRVRFVPSSGTGTLKCLVSLKGDFPCR